MLTGGCHCGAVRYQTDGEPFHETICHCDDCRRVSGAASVAWFSVARGTLTWIETPPSIYASSPGIARRFCSRCGTTLTYEDDRLPHELDIAIATLDEPGHVPPKDHVFLSQAAAWDIPGDGLPRYARSRREG